MVLSDAVYFTMGRVFAACAEEAALCAEAEIESKGWQTKRLFVYPVRGFDSWWEYIAEICGPEGRVTCG